MSRTLTSQELAVLRSDGLASKLFVIIDQPATVYTCRVNQTFTTHDQIAQVTYSNANGNLSAVLPGMTVLVGTSPGAWDRGLARVRKAWSSTVAHIGETSEIKWENGLYLTVVDEFSIWARHLRIVSGVVYGDYDIEYSDQHSNFEPVACMGTDRVIKLTGASAAAQLDASQSWVFGATITQYSWVIITGSGSLVNAATATPTLTITSPGRIVVRCTVTASNGKSSSGYRTIYVYSDNTPPVEAQLDDFSGSLDQGGWEFGVQIPQPLSSAARDYLKVILFTEDHPQLIGAVSGAENILAIGWLDEKECSIDQHNGQAMLSVKGAAFWLSRCAGYPAGIEGTAQVPAAWTQIQSLTVDKMLWHLLHWRSTLPACVDVMLSGDARTAPVLQAAGNLWQQIKLIAEESILATPFCDAFSRFILQIHPNLRSPAARNYPTILTLTKDDYQTVDIVARNADVSQYDVSGIDQNRQPILVASPGLVYGRFGQILSKDGLLFTDQNQALELAGLLLAREKRPYDITIDMTSAIRVIGLMPFGYAHLTILQTDTPAKMSFAGNVIPQRVEYGFSNGALRQTIYAEPETFPAPAVLKPVPQTGADENIALPPGVSENLPGFPLIPPPRSWWPVVVPAPFEPVSNCLLGTAVTGKYDLFPDKFFLTTEDSEKLRALIHAPVKVRPYGVQYPSALVIHGTLEFKLGGVWIRSDNPVNMMQVPALNGSMNPVFYGNVSGYGLVTWSDQATSGYVVYVSPIAATDIHGFAIELQAPPTAPGGLGYSFNFDLGKQGWVVGTEIIPNATSQGYPYNATNAASEHSWEGRLRVDYIPASFQKFYHWRYFLPPGTVYAALNANLSAFIDNQIGFMDFGYMLKDIASPHTVRAYGRGSTGDGTWPRVFESLAVESGNVGKEVVCFFWSLNRHPGPANNQYALLDGLQAWGWTGTIQAYRLNISAISLWNICPAGSA